MLKSEVDKIDLWAFIFVHLSENDVFIIDFVFSFKLQRRRNALITWRLRWKIFYTVGGKAGRKDKTYFTIECDNVDERKSRI